MIGGSEESAGRRTGVVAVAQKLAEGFYGDFELRKQYGSYVLPFQQQMGAAG